MPSALSSRSQMFPSLQPRDIYYDAALTSSKPAPLRRHPCLYPSPLPRLDSPMSCPDHDQSRSLVDIFAPKPFHLDLSPASSESSDGFDSSSSRSSSSRQSLAFEAFFSTRSRVVRFYNLLAQPHTLLSSVFHPQQASPHFFGRVPVPSTMWQLRDDYAVADSENVWAVFKTHEEACAALSLSGPAMSVATALESDLEPFHKLKRFALRSPPPTLPTPSRPPLDLTHLQMQDQQGAHQFSPPDLPSKGGYTISSNPPNPRTSFRVGDWICSSPKCAAHNFGRNVHCIGCGNLRSNPGAMPMQNQIAPSGATRVAPSPRFCAVQETYYSSSASTQQQQRHSTTIQAPYPQATLQSPSYLAPPPLPQIPALPKPAQSAHPLLTPSGRAFAVGGRVQNVSNDPLNPCVMYWPDNEQFPEQGQIRPSGLVGVPQPPIMNTGNRGPISHQPGDWICRKCNYLNWRRRKVCQTCLPYAEGNGDSISAAVQAERIALLTSVLSQTQRAAGGASAAPVAGVTIPAPPMAPRSHSMTPPQIQRRFVDVSPPQTTRTVQRSVHRSQSHYQLGGQYVDPIPHYTSSSPIYQTSGHRQPSPIYSTGPNMNRDQMSVSDAAAPTPVHLLPSSFFQETMDLPPSPSLSPTVTTASSADLSLEDYDSLAASTAMLSLGPAIQTASKASASKNIWKLDGGESKSLSAFTLPNQEELLARGKKPSIEQLRVPDASACNSGYKNNLRN